MVRINDNQRQVLVNRRVLKPVIHDDYIRASLLRPTHAGGAVSGHPGGGEGSK